MKIFRGLQSENELGGWNRILGDSSLQHDCQICVSKILNFSKLFNFWAFVLILNQRTIAYFFRQCAIAIKTIGLKIFEQLESLAPWQ